MVTATVPHVVVDADVGLLLLERLMLLVLLMVRRRRLGLL